MATKTILPGAWEFTSDKQYELFSLVVPTSWQQVVKSLAQKRVRLLGRGYPSVPVYSLDRIISVCFPNIIKTERNGWQRPCVPWLLASSRADLFDLPGFIKDWLREEFSCLGDDLESVIDNLDDDAWQWDDKPVILPLDDVDIRFQAIPDFLAVEFLKNPEVSFGVDNQYQLKFYRVVNLNQGAELMSWPPYPVPLIKYQKQVGTAYVSFVIRLKLQTVPWRSTPIVYHQLSIRRWMTEPLTIPYRGATAYIGDNRRWIDGKSQPFSFMPLSIKQFKTNEIWEPRWSKAISELLKINDSLLPEPNVLAAEPIYNWSAVGEEPCNIQAAIAYDTRHRGGLPCLPGVSVLDLASLDNTILNKIELDNFPLRRVGEAVKVSFPNKKFGKKVYFWERMSTPMLRPEIAAPAVRNLSPDPSPIRRGELGGEVGGEGEGLNSVLILWETEKCRDELIREFCRVLLLEKVDIVNLDFGVIKTVYKSPFGCICILTQHVGELTKVFDFDDPSVVGSNRQQKRIYCMDKRIREVVSCLPKPKKLSGAIIEIKPKPLISELDPKLALRIGAMKAGYVNQHIHALTKPKKDGSVYVTRDADNRVQRAVSDLLRQFGVLPIPLIDLDRDGISEDIWLVCFHVLRRTRKTTASNTPSTVALMVRVNAVTGEVQAITPSLQNWLPYPEVLSHLLTEKWNPDFLDYQSSEEEGQDNKDGQILSKFVSDCLRDCLNTPVQGEKLPHVLFMVEAQNARGVLKWLQNPKLQYNKLPNELKGDMLPSEVNRLWVVRLRTSGNTYEVPVTINKKSPGSKSSGLYCWEGVCDYDGAIYLSIRKPLNTEQGTSTLQKKQSRLDNGSLQHGNPRALEIAVVYCFGVGADKLASFVHNLRDRWPYFANEVALPLPFRFATLASEYAVSARDTEEFELEDEE
jgi:pPIWI_RE module N-terminal domain/RNaseH domain of pPIWI_RE/MID domain of pPIWI_RE